MQFEGLVRPGLNCIMWPCKSVVGTVSTRVQQLDVKCETKTLDNVFVQCEFYCGEHFQCWSLDVIFCACVVCRYDGCIIKPLMNHSFVGIISVQYQALLDRIYDAYYKLSDHKGQIKSYIFDAIRSTLPKMTLDSAFEAKDDIAVSVKESLGQVMSEYGYQIVQVHYYFLLLEITEHVF